VRTTVDYGDSVFILVVIISVVNIQFFGVFPSGLVSFQKEITRQSSSSRSALFKTMMGFYRLHCTNDTMRSKQNQHNQTSLLNGEVIRFMKIFLIHADESMEAHKHFDGRFLQETGRVAETYSPLSSVGASSSPSA
jgi:hypothetical protein